MNEANELDSIVLINRTLDNTPKGINYYILSPLDVNFYFNGSIDIYGGGRLYVNLLYIAGSGYRFLNIEDSGAKELSIAEISYGDDDKKYLAVQYDSGALEGTKALFVHVSAKVTRNIEGRLKLVKLEEIKSTNLNLEYSPADTLISLPDQYDSIKKEITKLDALTIVDKYYSSSNDIEIQVLDNISAKIHSLYFNEAQLSYLSETLKQNQGSLNIKIKDATGIEYLVSSTNIRDILIKLLLTICEKNKLHISTLVSLFSCDNDSDISDILETLN